MGYVLYKIKLTFRVFFFFGLINLDFSCVVQYFVGKTWKLPFDMVLVGLLHK